MIPVEKYGIILSPTDLEFEYTEVCNPNIS
jgi:hypothetical protein